MPRPKVKQIPRRGRRHARVDATPEGIIGWVMGNESGVRCGHHVPYRGTLDDFKSLL